MAEKVWDSRRRSTARFAGAFSHLFSDHTSPEGKGPTPPTFEEFRASVELLDPPHQDVHQTGGELIHELRFRIAPDIQRRLRAYKSSAILLTFIGAFVERHPRRRVPDLTMSSFSFLQAAISACLSIYSLTALPQPASWGLAAGFGLFSLYASRDQTGAGDHGSWSS